MASDADTPYPTISTTLIVAGDHCPHCEATTVQVKGGSGIDTDEGPRACLQCIADGGSCCSLAPLSRYAA